MNIIFNFILNLQLVLISMRFMKYIDWDWGFVLLPIIIISVGLLVFIVIAMKYGKNLMKIYSPKTNA